MASSTNTIELAQTGKRDHLIALEKKYQAQWEEEKIFHVDPPSQKELEGLTPAQIREKYPKWFGCFPFPYMNGSLHLGHAFTVTKIEFAAGFQRLLGKRALFPHGFHVTGMPIKAAADKIIREMELFGPDFQNYGKESEGSTQAEGSSTSTAVGKATKGKVAAKSTGHTYQFQIMDSIGVPRAEIKKFADPYHWLEYFPPIAMTDHKDFGTRIDWRRTFMTTDVNPYFDSFVRWQMNKLYALGKVKFGERYTIYSPKDGQPCMDHDRQDGEALGPQEYTGVKMEVVSWSNEAVAKDVEAHIGGRKLYLVAATLRPETMYGQTNCFVGTSLKYGIFAGKNNEAYLCTYRAARNMAFQGITATQGKIEQLHELVGSQIIGTKIKPPFAIKSEVYVLPMENVLANKGTGVVTSVPADSPDDFATITDLRKKPEFFNVRPEWVAALEPVPVLSTPTYGDLTAPALVKKLKINSQKDIKQLAEAKEIAYKEGFYNGTMLVGEFKGQPVQEVKNKVREKMIEAGLAMAYAEPEGLVISRSSDECVVALMDQWYMDYGEPSWRAQTEKLVAKMNTWNTETRNGFDAVLAWLNKWACARTYGLGSKLPWDPQFLVESLSDSTVYMAYYTVAYHLQGGKVKGDETGPSGIKPEQMTDEVWDYLFCDGPWPESATVQKSTIDVLKHEFNYFYPFDVRSSGKDLIPNHLTFCAYNHAALFPEEKWPLSIRTNGHLMLNGKKMSKSTGNMLTMKESVEKFGADATRIALADAGDGIEDANFEEKSANANILRVHTLLGWCEEMIRDEDKLRHGPKIYHDRVFEEEIKDLVCITKGHYESMWYKDALKYGFFELQSARDWYREVTADAGGMHADLVKYWIRVAILIVSPIAPHFAEHVWRGVLNEPKSIQLALWPEPSSPVERSYVEASTYMRGTIKMIRDAELGMMKKSAKGKKAMPYDPKKAKAVRVYVASKFPDWQEGCVKAVKEAYAPETDKVDDAMVRDLLTANGLIKEKRAMPFVQTFKKRMQQVGAQAAFNRTLLFSETEVLNEILPYLKKTLNLVEAEVVYVEDALSKAGEPGYTQMIMESSEPGNPAFEFRNV